MTSSLNFLDPLPRAGAAVNGPATILGLALLAAAGLSSCGPNPEATPQKPAAPKAANGAFPANPESAVPDTATAKAPMPESPPTDGATAKITRPPADLMPKDTTIMAMVRRFPQAPAAEQAHIVQQLLSAGTTDAVAGLLEILASLPAGELKSSICQGLSQMETREKRDFLLGALPYVDSDAQRAISYALGVQADGTLITSLVSRYDNTSDETIRSSVLQILRGATSADAIEMVAAIVNDPNNGASEPMVRAATQALAQNGSAPAVATLLKKMNGSTDPHDRTALSGLVEGITNPAAEATLIYSAQGNKDASDPATRLAAINALANYPTIGSLNAMRQLSTDANPEIQAASLSVAQKIESVIGK